MFGYVKKKEYDELYSYYKAALNNIQGYQRFLEMSTLFSYFICFFEFSHFLTFYPSFTLLLLLAPDAGRGPDHR